ncbi:MAG: glycoside hydrolase family 11 protein [Fibromonadaceae bacterium]|nr:glycoside hydrolase family 11 protein [Fibromonadaceae bacterium]
MKKLTIALCLAITFAFADDPCSDANSRQLSATASGVQSWEGTKNASVLGGSGDDQYGVEAWTEAGGDKTKLTWFGPNQGGGFAFRAQWTNSTDYLGRLGYQWGSNGKKWNALGDLCVDYNYTRSANGTGGSYSYLGIYGWTIGNGTSAEYYIVEDWFGADQQQMRNLGDNCQTHGNITVDGKPYEVITCIRPQGSGCVDCGGKAFGQVFSVRKNMRPEPAKKCGTISIKKHFDEWVKMTTKKGDQSPAQYIYDKTYESKFLAEAQGGTGWFEASFLKFSRAGNCGIVVPAGNYTLDLMLTPSNGGTVSKSPSASYYSSGSNVTVTATAASGWKFSSWDGDASGSDNPLTVKMDKNKVVTAKFVPIIDPDKNLVTNGTFTNTDNWTLNKWQNSGGTFAVSGGKANITGITLPSGDGAAIHSLQLVQNGITLVQGVTYRLTFDASAASARTIGVIIQKATDPWTGYFEKEVSLTTTSQTFTYEFTMEAASDEDGRFGFNFGNATPNVTISNVKLNYVAEEPTSSSSGTATTTSSSSGTGNPTSSSGGEDLEPILKNLIPLTHFSIQTLSDKALRIEVSSPSVVEIYDLKGNKVAKFNVSRTQQTFKLSLPNGVYFAKAYGTKSVRFVLK